MDLLLDPNRPFFIALGVAVAVMGVVGIGCCVAFYYQGLTPTYTITQKTVNGSLIHNQVYEVMILDGINPKYVTNALLLVPNEFGFILVDENESRYVIISNDTPGYKWVNWQGYEGAPFPAVNESFLIIIADHDKYEAHHKARGWTLDPSGRITVLANERESAQYLADVIEHECTHNIEPYPLVDYLLSNARGFSIWAQCVGYGSYPDGFRGWPHLYTRYVINLAHTSG